MERETKFNPSYKIYKPNFKDSSKGAASSWEWNPKTGNFFLTVAKQSGEKSEGGKPTFAWKNNAETFKLAEVDLAEICLVLEGKKEFLGQSDGAKGKGLFHQTQYGNSILKIYKTDYGLGMELSCKKGDNRFWGGHRLTQGECKYLSVILKRCMWEMYTA
jgi:hypothetical protein